MKKESIKNIHAAKLEFGKLIKNKTNPFHKSKYADLNALIATVEPSLKNFGFDIFQPILDDKVVTQIIEIKTGDIVMESSIKLPDIPDPQKIGSAITYYRRYTLQSLLGINAEDDDGNAGAGKAEKSKKKSGNNPKKKLTDNQFQKLILPENQKYINRYLNEYDMPKVWSDRLRNILKESENQTA